MQQPTATKSYDQQPTPPVVGAEQLATLLPYDDPNHGRGWVERAKPASQSPTGTRVVASFSTTTGTDVQLVDLACRSDVPNIATVYRNPRVSRGVSPASVILSPLELFIAFDPGGPAPLPLHRHHEQLRRLGVFGPPRLLDPPLWGVPNDDLPPVYGPIDLCDGPFGPFATAWDWFSMWHGVNNQHGAFGFTTGWSVVTGFSPPRCAAMCMSTGNRVDARASYEITDQIQGEPIVNILTTGSMGPGEGVGFQTYGPENGRTRIRVATENDDEFVFWAGASWGLPQDWLAPIG